MQLELVIFWNSNLLFMHAFINSSFIIKVCSVLFHEWILKWKVIASLYPYTFTLTFKYMNEWKKKLICFCRCFIKILIEIQKKQLVHKKRHLERHSQQNLEDWNLTLMGEVRETLGEKIFVHKCKLCIDERCSLLLGLVTNMLQINVKSKN